MEIAGLVQDYFYGVGADSADSAVIDSAFIPGKGWQPAAADRLAATLDNVRGIAKMGATAVAVKLGDRIADFSVPELTGYARRPLLGGSLI